MCFGQCFGQYDLLAASPNQVLNQVLSSPHTAPLGCLCGLQAIEASAVATAIAQETVRLKQAVKSTYRVAIQPAVVAGVQVPPGTVVQAYWHTATLATGPGVEEFRPEYWLSADRCHCSMNNDPNSMQVRLPHNVTAVCACICAFKNQHLILHQVIPTGWDWISCCSVMFNYDNDHYIEVNV